jgi:hypothetical protein
MRIETRIETTELNLAGLILPVFDFRQCDGIGKATIASKIQKNKRPLARTSNESVDPALEAICAMAMARRRYASYPSTTALAEDVQRWMAGEPVSAYEERYSQRLGRWIQHHQRLSQLIAAAVIIAIVAGTTLTIAARDSFTAHRVQLDSDNASCSLGIVHKLVTEE